MCPVGILFPHINDDARSKPHQIRIGLSKEMYQLDAKNFTMILFS